MSHIHKICQVAPGSIGDEAGLQPGDAVVSVNGTEITDIFDYQYLIQEEYLEVLIRQSDGEEWVLEVEKDEDEDLGLSFENGLMDAYRSCRNRCIFCFIDQMPPGMRETLYFKDDDSRLSFLQGNYITLTNMGDQDLDRIIRYHLSPINISVHTTNPALRCHMLHNRTAGEALGKMDRLFEAGITMNGQIVLCKGYNDGSELERTIRDLGRYCPVMESLSVVPVGLTRYREGLTPLALFTREEARQVIEQIETWQKHFLSQHGIHFVHASDEFYLLAGMPVPEADRYDGYLQLENGVGMLRLLEEETADAMSGEPAALYEQCGEPPVTVSVATGKLAYPSLCAVANRLEARYSRVRILVYEIRNDFFGETITVSGLLTGQDLMAQLKGKPLGERLLLPAGMVKNDTELFLDNVTKKDVENALQVPVVIVKSSGYDLVGQMLGVCVREMEAETEQETWHQPYEC